MFSTCFNAVLWVLVFLLRAFKVILLVQVSVGVLNVSVGAHKEAVPALVRRHMREGLAIQMGAKWIFKDTTAKC